MSIYHCGIDSNQYRPQMNVTKYICIFFIVWLRQLSLHNVLHKDNKCPYKNTNHSIFVPKKDIGCLYINNVHLKSSMQ